MLDGPTTRAIGNFQAATGLNVTQQPDPGTLAALGAAPSSSSDPTASPTSSFNTGPIAMNPVNQMFGGGASSPPTFTTGPHVVSMNPVNQMFGGGGSSPSPPTFSSSNGGVMNTGDMFQGTTKRVPLVLSASLGALGTFQFQVTPQFDFRGEHVIVDPSIAPNATVTPISVGPNVQVAGGSNQATMSGQLFPPTQTDCLRFGMDIANQGNQLTLTAASLLTSTSMTFTALVMGTVCAKMSDQARRNHSNAVNAGLAPAGAYSAGLAPAGAYR
jgi:hypothetical protein